MIKDNIRNRDQYAFLGPDFKAALDYFATLGSEPFEKADIRVPGTDILVKARPMQTKPESECSFEAHRDYADIHFVAYGCERIGYADMSTMKELGYNAEKDMVSVEGQGDLITLNPGDFMITLPQDAHMPCVCVGAPAPLGKLIAKIKM
ncbi:MAG: YhcH/YjgK/YiaL family protein [Clostridia bacterium]|nr:YhcH/YjgK/YiaL family protein [Clostridia bacterium]